VTPRILSRLVTRRGAARLAILLLILGLAAPHAWAWSKLRDARAALASHHPEEARRALESCQRVWARRATVHLLACRAAWQDGDVEAAARALGRGQHLLGGATEETAFEWALLQASAGNVPEVEEFLQTIADHSPPARPLVWEAMSVGYLRRFRTLNAMACLNQWLKESPDEVRALELRGQTFVAGKGVVRGTEDYRRVLELDPSRDATRRRLIDALLALGKYEEAAGHLERLTAESPDDPALAPRLARCYAILARGEEGRRLIDAALAKHPDDPLCLRTLGQIELLSRHWPEAEAALRRAVELAPEDYQAQQLLAQALQQQPGKAEEAKARLKVAEVVRERSQRIGELTSRKLAEFPLDPAVHYEMGSLLIAGGRGQAGEQWLLTALSLDPDHKPTHAALAAYYQSRGDNRKAEFHREKAAAEAKE
jgi:predicted Zn-dependent protease